MPDPADYYREIYVRGLGGETPTIPVAIAELERRAAEAMDAERGGVRLRRRRRPRRRCDANRDAFARRRLVPRMLRDVAERDLSTTVLGTEMPAPLMLAPIGVQKIVHEDGELATARAAAALGVPMIASTASHFTLEEIAEACGDGAALVPALLVQRARASSRASSAGPRRAGYGAIVVTVDTFIPGWKPRDLQQAWLPFLQGIGRRQLLRRTRSSARASRSRPEEDVGAATGHFLGVYVNPSLSWADLERLRELTALPIS